MGQCYWLPAVRPMLFVSKSASFSAPQIITQKLQAYKLGLLFFFLNISVKFLLLTFIVRKVSAIYS